MGTIISINITGFVGSDPQVRTVQTSNGDKQVASSMRYRRWRCLAAAPLSYGQPDPLSLP